MAGYLRARDRHFADVALVNLVQQLAEGYVLRRYSLPGVLKQHDERNDEQEYDYPKCKVPEIWIHLRSHCTSFRPRGRHRLKYTPCELGACLIYASFWSLPRESCVLSAR